uniref:Uncharacterized protein n=1 Tax=Arundo donax TaxID=35708 RepID=A0A0A8ZB65_ARUDO
MLEPVLIFSKCLFKQDLTLVQLEDIIRSGFT